MSNAKGESPSDVIRARDVGGFDVWSLPSFDPFREAPEPEPEPVEELPVESEEVPLEEVQPLTLEELESKLANGWYSHPDDIGSKAVATLSSDAPAPDVKSPESKEAPTRDELKLKATELGIDFANNVSDKKLRELIETKLADQAKE